MLGLAAVVGSALVALADSPTRVTPTPVARGTYEAFKVRSLQEFGIDFKAEAKDAIDIFVRRHDYGAMLAGEPIASTGWHQHPGPVFITVTQGELTFYEYDDPECTPHVVKVGQGYVDTGRGHLARNETGAPASDMTVIIAPVGGGFRHELEPTGWCDGF
jgi:hypothetical protein